MFRLNPLTAKKWQRFRALKRGWWSFVILLILCLLALVAELWINKRALFVSHEGQWHFPTYAGFKSGRTFGLDYDYEANYRELQAKWKAEKSESWLIMPIIPWDPYENDFRDDVQHPQPPDAARRHWLGTDKIGRDIAARLFYGFRVNMTFALCYAAGVYLLGIIAGCTMGYTGGRTDLYGQRLTEIWSLIPFLYMVMIAISLLPADMKVVQRIVILLVIMIVFSWTGLATYLRTVTMKEKARDYVAAASLLGASNMRLIFRHVLPNTLSTLVTFLPFTIMSSISALNALDYLAFGLPPPTPSWGDMLHEGVSQLSSPWIVLSAFSAITFVLLLVAFIGEAVRDAFDPKKFTTYR
ncbi:MAG TPA: peptide ABC transporter permease [Verrucomicrobiales bacterium]|nr:peptide ABC transporter permease [Verrucomicrobiales bacterium]HRJ07423.1 ABC transporter permease subunit [Prosthecobacter sp.]HRK12698.1 ABC transporter permease subunit [Prosthecobacter sp.]